MFRNMQKHDGGKTYQWTAGLSIESKDGWPIDDCSTILFPFPFAEILATLLVKSVMLAPRLSVNSFRLPYFVPKKNPNCPLYRH